MKVHRSVIRLHLQLLGRKVPFTAYRIVFLLAVSSYSKEEDKITRTYWITEESIVKTMTDVESSDPHRHLWRACTDSATVWSQNLRRAKWIWNISRLQGRPLINQESCLGIQPFQGSSTVGFKPEPVHAIGICKATASLR